MSHAPRHRTVSRASLATVFFAVIALPVLTACQGAGEGGGDLSDLPDLDDIESRITTATLPESARLTRGSRVQVVVRQIELPLYLPLKSVWEMIDESALPELSSDIWRTNGLRVGVIRRQELPGIFEEMPRPLAAQTQHTITGNYPTPLRESPRLDQPVTVDLTIPPGPVRQETVRRGRMRLLGRTKITNRGRVRLELLPQNHRHRITLKPPTDPRENDLAGRIYEEIGVGVVLAPDEVLVLGLYQQPSSEDEPHDSDASPDADGKDDQSEQEASSQAATEAEDRQAKSPDGDDDDLLTIEEYREQQRVRAAASASLPHHLGRSLMTIKRRDYPTQLLLLVMARPHQ